MSVTETLEREATDADGDGEPSPGEILAEVERRQYGDYVAGDVEEVRYSSDDGEIEFSVDIPGADCRKVWGWPAVSSDGETNLQRILRDHGLSPEEVEQMEGRRVLVRPHPRKEGTWKIYNPESPSKTISQEWHDEHPLSPYADGQGDEADEEMGEILFPLLTFAGVLIGGLAGGLSVAAAAVFGVIMATAVGIAVAE